MNILEAKNIKVYYPIKKGILFKKQCGFTKAVDDVSISIKHGETVGLVGESGCGKSTFARAILKLIPLYSGEINFQGENIANIDKKTLRKKRKDFQIIFQDPYASLNPKMTVLEILREPLLAHKIVDKKEVYGEVQRLLSIVGLTEKSMVKFPHEFSGGQRQRIVIARALSVKPKFLVADEPVSALDVSIQSQILNLISDLQKKMNLSLLFITHNMAVVKHICSRVSVMHNGKIIESGLTDDIFINPQHQYTQALLKAIPIPDIKTTG